MYLVSSEQSYQELLSTLLPQHLKYVETYTTEQSIVLSKRICRWNTLNWATTPIDSILEHLEYVTVESFELPLLDAISSAQAIDEATVVTDLTLLSISLPLQEAKSITQSVLTSSKSNLVVIDPYRRQSHHLLSCMAASPLQSSVLIDPYELRFFKLFYNYDISSTSFFKTGRDKSQRQKFKEKTARWKARFDLLPASMKQRILSSFLTK